MLTRYSDARLPTPHGEFRVVVYRTGSPGGAGASAVGLEHEEHVAMVMGESMRLVGIGAVVGIATALWAGRYVKAVLYGLPPHDPLTIAAAIGLIAMVSALAGCLPARRASKVDPLEARRQQ